MYYVVSRVKLSLESLQAACYLSSSQIECREVATCFGFHKSGITEKPDPGPVGPDPNGPDPSGIPIHLHVSR